MQSQPSLFKMFTYKAQEKHVVDKQQFADTLGFGRVVRARIVSRVFERVEAVLICHEGGLMGLGVGRHGHDPEYAPPIACLLRGRPTQATQGFV